MLGFEGLDRGGEGGGFLLVGQVLLLEAPYSGRFDSELFEGLSGHSNIIRSAKNYHIRVFIVMKQPTRNGQTEIVDYANLLKGDL